MKLENALRLLNIKPKKNGVVILRHREGGVMLQIRINPAGQVVAVSDGQTTYDADLNLYRSHTRPASSVSKSRDVIELWTRAIARDLTLGLWTV